jgi:predicted nucleic acid-binding protein
VALILDTNALSAAADCDPAALEVVAGAERLAVPVIVLGEFRLGIAQSRRRTDYENWLREWIETVTVLDIDNETAHQYAAIDLELKRLGKPIPVNDLWIAALCHHHSLPLLSRRRHFDVARASNESIGDTEIVRSRRLRQPLGGSVDAALVEGQAGRAAARINRKGNLRVDNLKEEIVLVQGRQRTGTLSRAAQPRAADRKPGGRRYRLYSPAGSGFSAFRSETSRWNASW